MPTETEIIQDRERSAREDVELSKPPVGINLEQPLTLEGYLDRAAELGADGLALADMGHFTSTDADAVDALRARADAAGLYVELGTGGVDLQHLRQAMALSSRFGSNVLRTFVSIGRTWAPQDYDVALARVVQALQRAAQACEETGVALAVENHQDLTSVELAGLLEAVGHPMVGACLDTGNSLGVLEHPLEAARNLADRVLTVHLKSYGILARPDGRGYVLVGVPCGQKRELLNAILALLAERCPGRVLHLNLEAAVEVIPVIPGRPGWREELAEAAAKLLESSPPDDRERLEPWIPDPQTPINHPDVLALEDRLVRTSFRQAAELLAEWGRRPV